MKTNITLSLWSEWANEKGGKGNPCCQNEQCQSDRLDILPMTIMRYKQSQSTKMNWVSHSTQMNCVTQNRQKPF